MDIRVSIFDDNDSLRESLYFLIAGTPGFTITGKYADCNNVIDKLSANSTDVVLMDIDMPGLSGIEGTALIKSHFPDINVLILTSYDDGDKVFDALKNGATGYLLKKTSPAKILDAITEVFNGGSPMNAGIARKVIDFFRENDKKAANNEYALSAKESDVLRCLVEGDSYKMIADHCYISMGTVRTHIMNIYKKLHVNSKSEAVAKAIREKLTGANG